MGGKVYWIVVIIARKAGIATAGLLFRSNPGFQLASILLVLFVAYVWQVKHQPFMSTVQRNETILEHREKVKQGDSTHVHIGKLLTASQQNFEKDSMLKRKSSLSALKSLDDAADMEVNTGQKTREREYFWDFNTVEQVLLSCAILVCVAGVMFESDRFKSDVNNRYSWQRDLITFLVILVVFFSIVYYIGVFMSEVVGYTPKLIVKLCARKQRAHHQAIRSLIAPGKSPELDAQGIQMHEFNFSSTNPL